MSYHNRPVFNKAFTMLWAYQVQVIVSFFSYQVSNFYYGFYYALSIFSPKAKMPRQQKVFLKVRKVQLIQITPPGDSCHTSKGLIKDECHIIACFSDNNI